MRARGFCSEEAKAEAVADSSELVTGFAVEMIELGYKAMLKTEVGRLNEKVCRSIRDMLVKSAKKGGQ